MVDIQLKEPSMPDFSAMTRASPLLTYVREDCATFRGTHDQWGGLSNMAQTDEDTGLLRFPLYVGGINIRTSEALYQACRFPHLVDVQRRIIDDVSPMGAKMVAKKHRQSTRADWANIEVAVMWWCLQIKLKQNWTSFAGELRSTGDLQIVEDSRKDQFWGAVSPRDNPETLIGRNVLGRLLMELRTEILNKTRTGFTEIPVPPIENLLILGRAPGTV